MTFNRQVKILFSLACVSSERHVPRQWVCFFSRFGLKWGINFDHFALK